jgi:hypothetical protein
MEEQATVPSDQDFLHSLLFQLPFHLAKSEEKKKKESGGLILVGDSDLVYRTPRLSFLETIGVLSTSSSL